MPADMRPFVAHGPCRGERRRAQVGRFIKQLAKISYSRAKQARVVPRLALELAVRHEVLRGNPMDHVSRLHREPHVPDALCLEVKVIHAAIAQRESTADQISPRNQAASSARSSRDARHLSTDRRGTGRPPTGRRRHEPRAV
jgi:hypothetical protein